MQVGVEDYRTGTRPRLLSAVRNIHARILLLYKEALRRESPPGSNDVLIMAKISPSRDANDKLTFVGNGKKTVDTRQIRERFDALGIQRVPTITSVTPKKADNISEVWLSSSSRLSPSGETSIIGNATLAL